MQTGCKERSIIKKGNRIKYAERNRMKAGDTERNSMKAGVQGKGCMATGYRKGKI